MKFCFLFLFKQINYSLLQRRSSAEKQFNLKTIPFCCLYDKNNCTSSTFVLRGKSNYFCLLSLFPFFGGMQLIKDTISTTTRLPITPWWEFNTRRGWKWNLKAAEREHVCGGRGLGWSRARQRPSNWRGLPPLFWWDSNDFPSAFSVSLHVCLFVCLVHRGGTVSKEPVLHPTRIIPLRCPWKNLHQKHHYRHLSRRWK